MCRQKLLRGVYIHDIIVGQYNHGYVINVLLGSLCILLGFYYNQLKIINTSDLESRTELRTLHKVAQKSGWVEGAISLGCEHSHLGMVV